MEFLDQVLLVLGGVVYWQVLVERAASQGIQSGLLRQAVTYWHLPSLFQTHEGELREVIGFPELIAILKEKQREEQAAAREALRAGRGPFGMDLAAGLAAGLASLAPPAATATTKKTSVKPPVHEAAATAGSTPPADSASFIKPELAGGGAGDSGEDEADLEGTTAPRNDAKPPAKTPQKVAQAL
jgi:hypothetical protein